MLSHVIYVLLSVSPSILAYPTKCPSDSARHVQHPICLGPPQIYVIEASEGKGLGAFATHDMEIGDIVMRETPVLKIRLPKLAKGSP